MYRWAESDDNWSKYGKNSFSACYGSILKNSNCNPRVTGSNSAGSIKVDTLSAFFMFMPDLLCLRNGFLSIEDLIEGQSDFPNSTR
jgi:hypothetical protein